MLAGIDIGAAEMAVVAVVALAAGAIRGFSGFGSALVLAPVLSVVVGPKLAIPAVMIALLVTTVQLVPSTWRHVRWRDQAALAVPGCVGVPIGVALLVYIDPEILRRFISLATTGFALFLMSGWRYTGRPTIPASAAAGSLGGFLSGAASIGGPPVIAYLLAGPDGPVSNRATLVYYFGFTQSVSIALYGVGGLLSADVLVIAAAMTPLLILGTWLGTKLFHLASERVFRWVALTLLLLIGLSTLAA